MSQELDLVRKYEPVLRFGNDGQGEPERFFPLAASHYVHDCGLRRKKVGWLQPPGMALLHHLGTVSRPQECYLSYAAGDLADGAVELLDLGLELTRVSGPAALPADVAPPAGGVAGAVVPRVLVSQETADALEAGLPQGTVRLPLGAEEAAALFGSGEERPARAALEEAFDLAPLPGGPALDTAAAAAGLEWVVPRGFASLPEMIHHKALTKYARYRDWDAYPPVYYYYVSQDGPFRILHYWFLYAYNDWAAHGGLNDHEGDWEVIFVLLDAQEQPQHVIYSRHVRIPWLFEPLTAPWSAVEQVAGTHPVVYVGCGSHASYLAAGTHVVLGLQDHALGNHISIGPSGDQPWRAPFRLRTKRWNRRFSGKWGSLVKSWLGMVRPGTVGPTGPGQKGEKWHRPAHWASLL